MRTQKIAEARMRGRVLAASQTAFLQKRYDGMMKAKAELEIVARDKSNLGHGDYMKKQAAYRHFMRVKAYWLRALRESEELTKTAEAVMDEANDYQTPEAAEAYEYREAILRYLKRLTEG